MTGKTVPTVHRTIVVFYKALISHTSDEALVSNMLMELTRRILLKIRISYTVVERVIVVIQTWTSFDSYHQLQTFL